MRVCVLCVFLRVLTVWPFFDRVVKTSEQQLQRKKQGCVCCPHPWLRLAAFLCRVSGVVCAVCVVYGSGEEDGGCGLGAAHAHVCWCAWCRSARMCGAMPWKRFTALPGLDPSSHAWLPTGVQVCCAPRSLSVSLSSPPSSGLWVTLMHTHALPFAERWLLVVPLS